MYNVYNCNLNVEFNKRLQKHQNLNKLKSRQNIVSYLIKLINKQITEYVIKNIIT